MFQFAGADLRIEAANAHGAGVWIAQAFKDFHGSGFAGAVGAKQAKDFAFIDGEAEASYGLHITVVLHEIVYLQDGSRHKA